MQIRNIQPDDIQTITNIYSHFVTKTAITFDLDAPTANQMAAKFSGLAANGYPTICAADENGLVGFAYASSYRPKQAYQHTCEVTIYLDPAAQGKGLGSKLMAALIKKLEASEQFHLAIAMIAQEAKASIGLHEKFDFIQTGKLREVGQKFGKWHDVNVLQRPL